jgi:hypothetical protein
MEYKFKTVLLENLAVETAAGMWFIPDNPIPGIIPPTIDEAKQMLWERMSSSLTTETCLAYVLIKHIPKDWEVPVEKSLQMDDFKIYRGMKTNPFSLTIVEKGLKIDNFRIHVSRSNGPMGWVTQVSADSYEFVVRRPVNKRK